MKHINYFDLGMNVGKTTNMMLSIFSELQVTDYSIYGFEPELKLYNELVKMYKNNGKINVINMGVADRTGDMKLYLSPNPEAYSLFPTKFDVDSNMHVIIKVIKFSEWLKHMETSLNESINVLKANIEASEYYLYNDLIDSGMNKKFHIICGTNNDIDKTKELADVKDKFFQKMRDNGVAVLRFTHGTPWENAPIRDILRNIITEQK